MGPTPYMHGPLVHLVKLLVLFVFWVWVLSVSEILSLSMSFVGVLSVYVFGRAF